MRSSGDGPKFFKFLPLAKGGCKVRFDISCTNREVSNLSCQGDP